MNFKPAFESIQNKNWLDINKLSNTSTRRILRSSSELTLHIPLFNGTFQDKAKNYLTNFQRRK